MSSFKDLGELSPGTAVTSQHWAIPAQRGSLERVAACGLGFTFAKKNTLKASGHICCFSSSGWISLASDWNLHANFKLLHCSSFQDRFLPTCFGMKSCIPWKQQQSFYWLKSRQDFWFLSYFSNRPLKYVRINSKMETGTRSKVWFDFCIMSSKTNSKMS